MAGQSYATVFRKQNMVTKWQPACIFFGHFWELNNIGVLKKQNKGLAVQSQIQPPRINEMLRNPPGLSEKASRNKQWELSDHLKLENYWSTLKIKWLCKWRGTENEELWERSGLRQMPRRKTSHAGHRHLRVTEQLKTTLVASGKINREPLKRRKTGCHVKALQDGEVLRGDRTFYNIITIRDERRWRTTTKWVTAPGEILGTKINKATCRLRYESLQANVTKYGPVSFVSGWPSHSSLQRAGHKQGGGGRKGNIRTQRFSELVTK